MASSGVRVQGLSELIRDLHAIGVGASDLHAAFGRIAGEAAQLARGFAPHRTGRLAASIKGVARKNYAAVSAGGPRVPYAAAINYGWDKHSIQPSGFMQRADAAIRPRALRDLQGAIETMIRARGMA